MNKSDGQLEIPEEHICFVIEAETFWSSPLPFIFYKLICFYGNREEKKKKRKIS